MSAAQVNNTRIPGKVGNQTKLPGLPNTPGKPRFGINLLPEGAANTSPISAGHERAGLEITERPPLTPSDVQREIETSAASGQSWAKDLMLFFNKVPERKDEILKDLADNPQKIDYLKAVPISIQTMDYLSYLYDEAVFFGEKAFNLQAAIKSMDARQIQNAIVDTLRNKALVNAGIGLKTLLNMGPQAIIPLLKSLSTPELGKTLLIDTAENLKNSFVSFASIAVEEIALKEREIASSILASSYRAEENEVVSETIELALEATEAEGYKAVLDEYEADIMAEKKAKKVSHEFSDLAMLLLAKASRNKTVMFSAPTIEFLAEVSANNKFDFINKDLLAEMRKIVANSIEMEAVEIVLEAKEKAPILFAVLTNEAMKNMSLLYLGISKLLNGKEGRSRALRYFNALDPIAADIVDVRLLHGFAFVEAANIDEAIRAFKQIAEQKIYQKEIQRLLSTIESIAEGNLYLALGRAYRSANDLARSAQMHLKSYLYSEITQRTNVREAVDHRIIDAVVAALERSAIWNYIATELQSKKAEKHEEIKDILSQILDRAHEIAKERAETLNESPANPYAADTLNTAIEEISSEALAA